MAENGWIKVYRKIMDKGYYKRSQYVHLWVHVLLKASHDETEFIWNGKIEKLKPGQFLTGRKQLSLETGISQTTIERILEMLESEHQIGQQKTNKFRLLTVINWLEYQKTGQQNGHPADIQRTSSGHPADTFKNEENAKKVKKKDIDVLAEHILEVLKISMSDKGQTESLLKSYGLEGMLAAVDRMEIYFKAVKENGWKTYIIGKYWRNLYEKIQLFSSDENLERKITDTRKSNSGNGRGHPAHIVTNDEILAAQKQRQAERLAELPGLIERQKELLAQYQENEGDLDAPSIKKMNEIPARIKELEGERGIK
jgi:uncharacterized protein YehS (DUF1456 family)